MIRLPERDRRIHIKYGLTPEAYEDLLKLQNGVCAICDKEENMSNQYSKRRLVVDHCHTTGRIRGLLCGRCNAAIGLMFEDITFLQKAVKYLDDKETP